MLIIVTILVYFLLLLGISRLTSRHADNDAFYRAGRRSPWPMVAFGMVAFGMVGASISGVTFVSVPGMVLSSGMTYLQMCLGFIVGYFIVAFVLLPVYYGLNLTSIYSFLGRRLGTEAHRTGAAFFLLSKMLGAAVAFYVVCDVVFQALCGSAGTMSPAGMAPEGSDSLSQFIAYSLLVVAMTALIWLYTYRGGIKTLVWTDTLQTLCLFGALLIIIYKVTDELGLTLGEAAHAVAGNDMSRVFVWDDWASRQNFWKQFLSGVFVVIVMTGLDQDKMQKNLTCRTLREAQKDMCSYGFAFVPANMLFLSLGVLLSMLAESRGIALPARGDELLPMFAASGSLGPLTVVLFTVGIVAASFSTADSALTSMTTSTCVDLFGRQADERLRRRVHLGLSVAFAVIILLLKYVMPGSAIDAIYTIVGYTYGPLLGLFSFALLQKARPRGQWVPCVCIASPVACFLLSMLADAFFGYHFGYELLMLNGLLTFAGLWLIKQPR